MRLVRLLDQWQLKLLSKKIKIDPHSIVLTPLIDHQTTEVSLVQWTCHESGSHKIKTPLVLVHGLGSSAGSYTSFLLHAAEHFETIMACSAPGHGMSPYHPVAQHQESLYKVWETYLLQVSEQQKIILMGNSLGGAVSLRFTLSYPERVESLILCSPAGAQLQNSDLDFIRSNFKMDSYWSGHIFLKKLFVNLPKFWWIIGFMIRAILSRPTVQKLLTHVKEGDGFDGQTLNQLKPPSMIFWGKGDRILPKRLLDYYQEHMPKNCTFITHHMLGHSPQSEDGKLLVSEVLRWLTSLR